MVNNFIKKIAGSFDTTTKDGFSARKLTAFVVVCCILTTHVIWWIKYDIRTHLVEVLLCDFSMIAALFGLTTFEPKSKPNTTTDAKQE